MADDKGQQESAKATDETKVVEEEAQNVDAKPDDVVESTVPESEKSEKDEKPTSEDAKKEEETKANNEEEEESSDEEMLGLFDKDVIVEGKRERKQVPRLSSETITTPLAKRNPDLDFTLGKGTRFGDIEWTEYEITRSASDELKPLHRLLYGRDGKTREVKKNMRNFCGYPFDKSDVNYNKKKIALDRFTLNGVRRICEIFNLKKGTRDEMMSGILSFLMKPADTGKKAPTPGDKKKKTPKKTTKKTDNKKASGKTAKSKENVSDDDDDDNKKTDAVKPEKKKSKKVTKNAKTESPKKGAAKDRKESKSPVKKTKSPVKEKKATKVKLPSKPGKASSKRKAEDSDEDDDEPLVKKKKSGPEPTNDDIKKKINSILDGADLESITMKIVCKQVAESFPEHDLSSRKKFIKETVKEIIS